MGVDTKGFVLTPCKDVMRIGGLVAGAIDRLISEERNIVLPKGTRRWSPKATEMFQETRLELIPASEMLRATFRFHKEERCVHVFFGCDCDQKNYGPKSISFSMGAWGQSELYAKAIVHALSLVGPGFYDLNDCDDIDPQRLDEPQLSVLGAMALGYVSHTALDDWIAVWRSGVIGDGRSADEFFGMPFEQAMELANRSDYESAWDEVKIRAAAMSVTPQFMLDWHEEAAHREAQVPPAALPAEAQT